MHKNPSFLQSILFFGCISSLFLFVYISGCVSSLSFPDEIIKSSTISTSDDADAIFAFTSDQDQTKTNEEGIPGISSNHFSFPSTPLSSINVPTPPMSLTDTSMLIVSGLYTISPENMDVNPLRLLVEVDVANTAKLDAKNVQLDYEFRYNGNTVGSDTIFCGIIAAGDVRLRSKTVFIPLPDNLFVRFKEKPSALTMHLVNIRV